MSEAELWIYRGDDEQLQFTFEDSEENPISIAQCGITMTVRDDWDSEDIVMVDSVGPGEHVDAVNGITQLSFSREVTENLEPKGYVYDIQVMDENGVTTTVIADDLFVREDATR